MINIFPLDEMRFTPFGPGGKMFEDIGRSLLRERGIEITTNPRKADLFVTRIYPLERRTLWKKCLYGVTKPLLIWTHEPRYNVQSDSKISGTWILPRIEVMNLYTGNLYLNNYSFYSWAIRKEGGFFEPRDSGEKKIVAVMGFVRDPKPLWHKGVNIDLFDIRQRLALHGFHRGVVDIYGREWPEGIAQGESRGDGWRQKKEDILNGYRFNICLENTNIDYYCTEKIWDAIHGGCLPIYYGKGNRIYDIFPHGSFIDVADYPDYDALYDHILAMDEEEYRRRLAQCVSVYKRFIETSSFEKEFEKVIDSTARRICGIVATS